LIAKKGKEKT